MASCTSTRIPHAILAYKELKGLERPFGVGAEEIAGQFRQIPTQNIILNRYFKDLTCIETSSKIVENGRRTPISKTSQGVQKALGEHEQRVHQLLVADQADAEPQGVHDEPLDELRLRDAVAGDDVLPKKHLKKGPNTPGTTCEKQGKPAKHLEE